MTAKKNPHIGSSLDSFLDAKGVRGEMEARAVKEVIAWQLGEAMREQAISKARMAVMMKTSRAQLDRLLDPERDVTLSTLAKAASIVGRQIRLELT
jgi:hypothetical protein